MNKSKKEFRNTSTANSRVEYLKIVKNYLPKNSSLLLLGIGSGKEFEFFSELYSVTCADFSKLLLMMFQQKYPKNNFLNIDPVELNTNKTFDCIFSNKVLSQTDEKELVLSLQNQVKLLNDNGVAIHSFWQGEKEEDHHGLILNYYSKKKLKDLVPQQFEVLEINSYKQDLEEDSLFIVLKKN
jgi:trans-aconitate methyltransferase